jgi:hypothetical protein
MPGVAPSNPVADIIELADSSQSLAFSPVSLHAYLGCFEVDLATIEVE